MPDPIEDLLKALRNEQWIADLEKRTEDLTQEAQRYYDGDYCELVPNDDYLKYVKGNWVESLGQASCNAKGPEKLAFEQAVDRLSPPRVVTGTELWEAFEVYLVRVYGIPGAFEDVYAHFLDHIEHRLLAERRSDPFKVSEITGLKERVPPSPDLPLPWLIEAGKALGKAELLGTTPEIPGIPPSDGDGVEQEESPVFRLVLWSGNGIRLVCCHIEISSEQWHFQSPEAYQMTSGILHAHLEGRMSPEAMRSLHAEFLPVLRSIIRSAAALSWPLPATGSSEALPSPPGVKSIVLNLPVPGGSGALPSIGAEQLRESIPFIGGCCQMLFVARTKKDTWDRRISNAIRLLREADSQANSAISLALCVTALEALLGDPGQDIVLKLASNVAVLLEPRPNQRARAADFTKRLYNLRSRVLHGDTVEGEDNVAAQARRLAAGVLYGIWYRRDFLTKMQVDPGSPAELLKTLQECTWTGKPPDGVPDIPLIRLLWEGGEPETNAPSNA